LVFFFLLFLVVFFCVFRLFFFVAGFFFFCIAQGVPVRIPESVVWFVGDFFFVLSCCGRFFLVLPLSLGGFPVCIPSFRAFQLG